MRKIAHISDLHFDRVDPQVVEAVVADLARFAPHVVVVSGDLTQRAKPREFRAARAFVDRLSGIPVVIPGNHDIPLFNVYRRFIRPLRGWTSAFGDDLAPFHVDEEVAVLGLNTARSFTWKNGRLSYEQMTLLRERMESLPPGVFKIVATHHPFLPPPMQKRGAIVGRAEHAMRVMDDCRVDMILAGHLHLSYAAGTHAFYHLSQHSALMVQAGTATSNRTRTERNAYNAVTVDGDVVTIAVRLWNGAAFETEDPHDYVRVEGRWGRRLAPART